MREIRPRRRQRGLLAQEGDLGSLDVHHRLGEAQPLDRLPHPDPGHRAVEVMPDQPAAGRQGLVRLEAVVEGVFQVVPAVDEGKLQGRQPAEIVEHRVGRDEGHLAGLAELVGESTEISAGGVFDLLLPRAGRRPLRPLDDAQAEDLGVLERPPGEIGRHVPERRADLQQPPRPDVCQQREHGVRVGLPGVAAKRAGDVRAAEPAGELRAAHG